MKLFNTASRTAEELKPLHPPQVTVYTCGPTVYLDPHIGNWRAFIFYDTLIRALKASGYKTKHVLNITDVGHLTSDHDEGEDKLAAAAKKERQTAWQVAEHYIGKFKEGVELLNFLQPDYLPRATDHIKEQIDLIKKLESKGFTYVIDDGAYFDTSGFKNYGQLAGGELTAKKAGARVKVNPQKKHPHDFALWKFSDPKVKRDMEWESPWGKGWPGWHLECSAMAMKYLGPTIDIHAGGVDHIGTHHPNEIAQSEAATGKTFAKIWLHNEFLLAEGKKMAKSAHNYYVLDDIVKKQYQPLAFRLLMAQAHYRSQVNFTWEALAAAQAFLDRLQRVSDIQFQAVAADPHGTLVKNFETFNQAAIEAIQDDLNTPKVLDLISGLVDFVDRAPLGEKDIKAFKGSLALIDALLGLDLTKRKNIDPPAQKMIHQRTALRLEGDFAKADAIRRQLEKREIMLDDKVFGSRWYRKA